MQVIYVATLWFCTTWLETCGLTDVRRIYKDGDYILGFILSAHNNIYNPMTLESSCAELNPEGILAVQSTISAIEQINSRPDILPGIRLGFDIRDDCYSKDMASSLALDFLQTVEDASYSAAKGVGHRGPDKRPAGARCPGDLRGAGFVTPTAGESSESEKIPEKPVMAVVGGSFSAATQAIATILQAYQIPVLSYWSCGETLGDKDACPSFVRLTPPDVLQVKVIVDLLEKFRWNYVFAVASDSIYGREGLAALEKEAEGRKICLKMIIDLPRADTSERRFEKAVSQLRNDARLKVGVVFMFWPDVQELFREARRQNVTGITWIASDSWSNNPGILKEPEEQVKGMLGISVTFKPNATIDDICTHKVRLSSYSLPNVWLLLLFCKRLGIDLNNCSHGTLKTRRNIFDLCFDTTLSPEILNINQAQIFDTIFSVALGLHSVLFDSNSTFDYVKLLSSIRSVDFRGFRGMRVKLNEKSEPVETSFAIVNYYKNSVTKKLSIQNVGYWFSLDGKSEMNVDKEKIKWNAGTVPPSQCSERCSPGFLLVRSPQECCWGCDRCSKGSISDKVQAVECRRCSAHEHTDPDQTVCLQDAETWVRLSSSVGVMVVSSVLCGELLVLASVVVLSRQRTRPIHGPIELKRLNLAVSISGFLPPALYVFRPSVLICTFRTVLLLAFFIVHSAILFTKAVSITGLATKLKTKLNCGPTLIPYSVLLLATSGGALPLGLSLREAAPVVKTQELTADVVYLSCSFINSFVMVTIMYTLVVLAVSALVLSKQHEGIDVKFLFYTVSVLLLTQCIFVPLSYMYKEDLYKRSVMEIMCVTTSQYAVVLLTYATKIYFIVRNSCKKRRDCERPSRQEVRESHVEQQRSETSFGADSVMGIRRKPLEMASLVKFSVASAHPRTRSLAG